MSGAKEPDFSVVSYNILADCHMKPDWYPPLLMVMMVYDNGVLDDGEQIVCDNGVLHDGEQIVCKGNGNGAHLFSIYFLPLSTLIMYMYWKFRRVLSVFGCVP